MPKFYIKTMVELEDHLADSLQKDKANKKKSSGNSKAMNNLKQKLRKLAKQFDESITAYRKASFFFSPKISMAKIFSSQMLMPIDKP